eukprot:XP_011683317.1 PREDICTED: uncharacterized protein LOC105447218 [Strongylocentrotus purpuratus]
MRKPTKSSLGLLLKSFTKQSNLPENGLFIMDPEESTHFNNNNNRTPVLSSEDSNLPLSALIPVVAIYGIFIATTVIGNLLVIISYFQDRKLRQRPANLIILNLAFADLIVGLVSLTVNLTTSRQFDQFQVITINRNFDETTDYRVNQECRTNMDAVKGVKDGHHIDAEGIRPLEERVKEIREFTRPSSLRQLRGFLGLVNFYRRFIPHCSDLLQLLTDILRNQKHLIVGLVSLTVNLTTIVSGRWLFGEYICRLYSVIDYVAVYVSQFDQFQVITINRNFDETTDYRVNQECRTNMDAVKGVKDGNITENTIMDPEESTHFNNNNNNNRTPVLSSEDSNLPLSALIPVVAIYGIFIATTVIGNLLVIISYFQDRKLRQRPANLIILNLAFADLIVGLVSLTVNLTTIVSGRWLFGEYICRLYSVIDYVAVYVSCVMIVFISIDRYLLVTKPIKHRSFVTRKRVRYAIISAWIINFTVFVLLSFGWSTFGGRKETMDYSHECAMEFLVNPLWILKSLPNSTTTGHMSYLQKIVAYDYRH